MESVYFMKKKIITFSIVVLIILLSVLVLNFNEGDRVIYTDEKSNQVMNTNALTMMYETEAGSGEYQVSSDTLWPQDGYIFNETLSKCENGGILSWNSETNKVVMQTNISDKCYVYFDVSILTSLCSGLTLSECITTQVYTGTDGENNLYYHDGQGSYTNASQEAGDNSYRYAGGDYEIAESYQGTYSKIYGEIIKRYCDGVEDTTFMDSCSGNLYFTLAYDINNTQYQTINEALTKAVSDGYITGDNVKNYVCFGTDVTPCPEENLYRILGVYDGQVKLIKADFANSNLLGTDGDYSTSTYEASKYLNYNGGLTTINRYFWNNYTQTNTWSESNLNTINLNYNFLNNFSSSWSSKIAEHTWQVGDIVYSNIYDNSVQIAYNYEIGSNAVNTTYNAKVGLMYLNDYGYAASPSNWNTYMGSLGNDINWANNWLYSGVTEWVISHSSDYSNSAFYVNYFGGVDHAYVNYDSAVRPVFYLESFVSFLNGTGSIEDPYTIN